MAANNEVKINKSDFSDFINLCKLTQESLKDYLVHFLKQYKYNPITDKGFVYAKGELPILLTAHLDTVHATPVVNTFEYTTVNGNHAIKSPQGIGGDDRCGVFAIMEIVKSGLKPYILFCEDEEVGGRGSSEFSKSAYISELSEMRYLVELDRCNSNDAVFYDCANDEFTDYILSATGYKESYGSFSDISILAPACGVAAVNLSCGYYKAHTKDEYVVMEELFQTIEVVKNLLDAESKTKTPISYEYIEYTWSSYYSFDDYDWSDYYYGGKERIVKSNSDENSMVVLYVDWIDKDGKLKDDVVVGGSRLEAWGTFFTKHSDVSYSDVYDFDFDYERG